MGIGAAARKVAMNSTHQARLIIGRLDQQAEGNSFIHRVNPLVKLFITIVFIAFTTSYGKYDLSGMVVMILFPVVLYQLAMVSISECFYRMRYVMPLVCAVGIVNPFFDKEILLSIGGVGISGGVVSMVTLIVKGILCVMMSYLLIATTSIEELCSAMRRVHIPAFFVTLILLTYRFVAILLDEVSIMTDAYKLRAPEQNGIQFSAWGSFLGQLILRSVDRAQALFESMVLRGYNGEISYFGNKRYSSGSLIFMVITIGLMIFVRFFNVAELLGSMI